MKLVSLDCHCHLPWPTSTRALCSGPLHFIVVSEYLSLSIPHQIAKLVFHLLLRDVVFCIFKERPQCLQWTHNTKELSYSLLLCLLLFTGVPPWFMIWTIVNCQICLNQSFWGNKKRVEGHNFKEVTAVAVYQQTCETIPVSLKSTFNCS